MASHQRHTDLVNTWRRSFWAARDEIQKRLKHSVMGTVDMYHPYGSECRGDAYLFLNDGFSPIPVECGSMRPEGKWDHCIDKDKLPIRLIRLSFDHGFCLLNPRGTEIERLYIEESHRFFDQLRLDMFKRTKV